MSYDPLPGQCLFGHLHDTIRSLVTMCVKKENYVWRATKKW